MGGSSGKIFYSDDYGKTWDTVNSPYNSTTRMHTIYMSDDNNGISGALENYIYTTNDNWKTSKKIPTPFDQNMYASYISSHSDNRIEKVRYWKDYIVVNQNGRIYFTDKNDINWKRFPVKLEIFELSGEYLYAITKNLEAIKFNSPTDYKTLNENKLEAVPRDIKVVNNSLYALCNSRNVYKINEQSFTLNIPYTEDNTIKEPRLIAEGNNIIWGVSWKNIYLKDEIGWYRINTTEMGIHDIHLIDDSTAILWDGNFTNYKYDLRTNKLSQFTPINPIADFLSSPLIKIAIVSGSQGCFHSIQNSIVYTPYKESTFITKEFFIGKHKKNQFKKFRNKIDITILNKALNDYNKTPEAIPKYADFNVTEKDFKDYYKLVKQRANQSYNKLTDKEFYYSLPKILDTANVDFYLKKILTSGIHGWSTTHNYYNVYITNAKGEKITLSKSQYTEIHPGNLPWEVKHNGFHYTCYSLDFSKFIEDALPDDFMFKENFSNSGLLMKLADFFWYLKVNQQQD